MPVLFEQTQIQMHKGLAEGLMPPKYLLEKVVERIGKNATLVWVEGGDHSLKRGRKDQESLAFAAQTIEDWIAKKN